MSRPEREAAMFKIKHSHGFTETVETYDDAFAVIRAVYGAGAEIGHNGDIDDGGESTLCWRDAAAAANDDGSRAVAKIIKQHPSA